MAEAAIIVKQGDRILLLISREGLYKVTEISVISAICYPHDIFNKSINHITPRLRCSVLISKFSQTICKIRGGGNKLHSSQCSTFIYLKFESTTADFESRMPRILSQLICQPVTSNRLQNINIIFRIYSEISILIKVKLFQREHLYLSLRLLYIDILYILDIRNILGLKFWPSFGSLSSSNRI